MRNTTDTYFHFITQPFSVMLLVIEWKKWDVTLFTSSE